MSDLHDHDLGLAFDVATLLDRRRAMKLIAGAGLVAIAACGGDDEAATGSSSTAAASASCDTIPEETAGPFPGDGSNGPNILAESGIVRRDITSSFGSSTTKAEGVPLTINLVVADQASSCSALGGAAVYLWHCDRDGLYSMYSQGAADENYLRGVQETDADGRVTFESVFPGAYSGRWPHIHFEVYASLADATGSGSTIATSQLALPEAACTDVYATSGYESSVRNLAQTSLSRDNVFGDGSAQQLAALSGSASAGYTAELSVPV